MTKKSVVDSSYYCSNQSLKNSKTRRRVSFPSGFGLNYFLRLFLRYVFQGFNQEIPEFLNRTDMNFFVW